MNKKISRKQKKLNKKLFNDLFNNADVPVYTLEMYEQESMYLQNYIDENNLREDEILKSCFINEFDGSPFEINLWDYVLSKYTLGELVDIYINILNINDNVEIIEIDGLRKKYIVFESDKLQYSFIIRTNGMLLENKNVDDNYKRLVDFIENEGEFFKSKFLYFLKSLSIKNLMVKEYKIYPCRSRIKIEKVV